MGRLDDRVAVVTGAGRGIGRATALRFAEEGATVVVNDIDPDPAADVVEEIKKNGGRAVVAAADITEFAGAKGVIESAVSAFGRLDILVNNAGITRDKTFHNMTPEIWDAGIKINLYTAYNMTHAAMPFLREVAKKEIAERGEPAYHRKITFTSSVVGITGNPGQANYTAAKGAIISLTKTLARELGAFRINVNAVAPGFVETRLTAAKKEGTDLGIPDALRNMALMTIALGRPGRPEDIANAHLFLCSSEADYISGVVIPVTGAQLGS
ncbi:MAG: glucose 1-dehydrogenase [Acidobacteria bacterium]|nr:glucose 1-dehydrogenase [Acidobacteriota bacterium]